MSHPGVVHNQPPLSPQYYAPQQQQQQQQQFSPYREAIEMRPTAGFTRLPQDPPPHPRGNIQMETTMSNGIAMHPAPGYNNPPSYTRENSQTARPFSHHNHNYEELPLPPTESSTDDMVFAEQRNFQRQGSHTEVDQYFNPPQPVHSISSTPLTITEPAEKKPRKKLNPIYDGYQGPADKITTSKEGSQKNLKSSKGQHRSFPVRCLRHPFTTVFIFLLVAVVLVAVVLIMLGTIETPVGPASPEKRIQSTPKATPAPATTQGADDLDPMALLGMIQDQARTIEELKTRISTLEGYLGGSSEVNASLSARVAVNTMKIETLDAGIKMAGRNISAVNSRVESLQTALSNTLSSLETTKIRTTTLENTTHQLDLRLGALSAKAATQSVDILNNKNKNDDQDVQISAVDQRISVLDEKFGHNLAEVNRTIYGELDTISKMQGPRGYNGSEGPPGERGPPGPAGAGDLSQCDYNRRTDNAAYGITYTNGPWISADANKVITGFTCSTLGGTLALLESDDSSGTMRYRCRCVGQSTVPTNSQRTCYTHYWQCPETS